MSKKSNQIDLDWLCQQIGRPTIYNITHKILALVDAGKIKAGMHLPPIRVLARALNISSTTVTTAFNDLKARNVIRSKQGVGTVVIDNPATEFPQRFVRAAIPSDTQRILNLYDSHPDPVLVPSLESALFYAVKHTKVNNMECQSMIPELQAALALNWPYPAQSFMAYNTPYEVINHLLNLFVPPNDYIAIETPTSVNVLDKLKRENVRLLAVERDKQGPIIASLANALAKKPALFIYQPREHLATAGTVSKTRMAEMVALFKACPTKTMIIENDIIGDLSGFPSYSLGEYLPEQTLYIRSYLKVYSSDLCFMVTSGPESLIQQLYHYRLYNLGWNSQLLQYALAWLLQDKTTQQQVKRAQIVYKQRYSDLLAALKTRQINLPNDNQPHLFLWLPVRSEQLTLNRLAEKGIIGYRGSHFMVTPPDNGKEYVRIMTSQLTTPELINRVADAIAFALLTPIPKNETATSYNRVNQHPTPLWGRINNKTKIEDTSSIN